MGYLGLVGAQESSFRTLAEEGLPCAQLISRAAVTSAAHIFVFPIDHSPLSAVAQEQHLMLDLLHVCMGYQGNSIRFVQADDTVKWVLNARCSEGLRNTLDNDGCLPLATELILLQICAGISRGRVALAVAGVAGGFFHTDIVPKLINLERDCVSGKQTHSLTEFALTMRPYVLVTKHINSVLSAIIKRDLVGGEILTLLFCEMQKCSSMTTRKVLAQLHDAAWLRYIDYLISWICCGEVHDFCHEFMIWDLKRTGLFSRSCLLGETDEAHEDDILSSFDKRYCAVKALCPSQLLPVYDDILKCGVYLKVVRKIQGKNAAHDDAVLAEQQKSMWKDIEVSDVVHQVKQICLSASQELIKLLREKFALHLYFELFHHFFFYFSHWHIPLLDVSWDLLFGPLQDRSLGDLQIFFEESLDCSTIRIDKQLCIFQPVLEKRTVFAMLHLIEQKLSRSNKEHVFHTARRGVDMLSVNVAVDLPLSLAFPLQIVLQYITLFRILFQLHSVTLLICRRQTQGGYLTRKERCLLQEMFHFWNAYNVHCSLLVIASQWPIFMAKLSKADSLEDILSLQNAFFNGTVSQCLLPDLDFLNLLSTLLDVTHDFGTGTAGYEQSYGKWKTCLEAMDALLLMQNSDISEHLRVRYVKYIWEGRCNALSLVDHHEWLMDELSGVTNAATCKLRPFQFFIFYHLILH
ncbi:unnamed protein product [Gongylonema pulchrum]|uniref:Gamma-tubulin complex component n=1 Tax=Gongylonema pulchrum TaxID=637853 RepID=A0A183DPY5_9BILA|nr:unnamed protein product [Gongylonema pulchrum]